MKSKFFFIVLFVAIILGLSSCSENLNSFIVSTYIENATLNTIYVGIKKDSTHQVTFFRVEPYDRLLLEKFSHGTTEEFPHRPFVRLASEIVLKIDTIDYVINDSTDLGSDILFGPNYIENKQLMEWKGEYNGYEVPFIFSITDEYVASLKK